jgi:hypothetical protein
LAEKIVVAHLVADMQMFDKAYKVAFSARLEHSHEVVGAVVVRPIAWFVEVVASRDKSSQNGLADRRYNNFCLPRLVGCQKDPSAY